MPVPTLFSAAFAFILCTVQCVLAAAHAHAGNSGYGPGTWQHLFSVSLLGIAGLWPAAGVAQTDSRIDSLVIAWNAGDVAGVQSDFNRNDPKAIFSMARIAAKAAQGGRLSVEKVAALSPWDTALLVDVAGRKDVWILTDCENAANPRRYCWFGHREPSYIGMAEWGQGLDVATTAVGTGMMGAVEANPLGLALLPIKSGFLRASRNMTYSECVANRTSLDAMGFGAGIANIVTLLVSISSLPLSVGIMTMTALGRWGTAEEAAWYDCAEFKLANLAD